MMELGPIAMRATGPELPFGGLSSVHASSISGVRQQLRSPSSRRGATEER